MLDEPNILHLMLAFGGAGCLYAAVLEVRQRAIPSWRLFLPPALSLPVAAVAALGQLIMERPPWFFAVALGIGLAIGGVRGLSMTLQVDQYWSLIQLRRTAKRGLLWIAALVAAVAALECGAAITGQPLATWRLGGALVAVACTGMLWGRAVLVAIRMRYAPHVDL